MENKIRFAVVGCCNMANRHSDGIAAIEGAELVCVCDNVEERRKRERRSAEFLIISITMKCSKRADLMQ
jgi:predicted dehydrogenase